MSYHLLPLGYKDISAAFRLMMALALNLVSAVCLASTESVSNVGRVYIPSELSAHSSVVSGWTGDSGINALDCPAVVMMTCPLSLEALQAAKQSPHPTSILGAYKETLAPVAGMKGDMVQVLLGEQRVSLKRAAAFDLVRAQAYGAGELKVLQKSLSYQYRKENRLPYRQMRVGASVVVEYQPAQDIEDCYAAVLLVREDFLKGASNELQIAIRFENLGNLKAGTKSEFQVSLGQGVPWTGIYAIPLFFHRGSELRSSEADLIAAFFTRVEQTRLAL